MKFRLWAARYVVCVRARAGALLSHVARRWQKQRSLYVGVKSYNKTPERQQTTAVYGHKRQQTARRYPVITANGMPRQTVQRHNNMKQTKLSNLKQRSLTRHAPQMALCALAG